jgi:hypothetical protein
MQIMEILEEEGVEVAFPSRTIYVPPHTIEEFQTMVSYECLIEEKIRIQFMIFLFFRHIV